MALVRSVIEALAVNLLEKKGTWHQEMQLPEGAAFNPQRTLGSPQWNIYS